MNKKISYLGAFALGTLSALMALVLIFTLGDNRVSAMTALIQADAGIIAFLAVVSTFMVTVLREEKRRLKVEGDDLTKDIDNKRLIPRDWQKLLDEVGNNGFQRGWVDASIKYTFSWSKWSAICLAISIAGALIAMSNIFVVQYVGIFLACGGFVFGLITLVFIFSDSDAPQHHQN